MFGPEVLLVFPPIVYSNFGRYYPSTAVLAAYLDVHEITVEQWDLNQVFLNETIAPSNLKRILAGGSQGEYQAEHSVISAHIGADHVAEMLAARAIQKRRNAFRDENGKLLSAGHPLAPLAVLETLTRRYYIDFPIPVLASKDLWGCREVIAFQDMMKRITPKIPGTIKVIGLSVPMGPQLGSALVVAKLIKEKYGAIRIVLGGPTITLLRKEAIRKLLLAHKCVDAAVQFQGEAPLLGLVKHYREGGSTPWLVPGVLALEGDKLRCSPPSDPPRIDALPFGKYQHDILDQLSEKEIAVRQAEGCYWGKCTYCDYVELYPKSGPRYRGQHLKRLVDEIAYQIERTGTRRFCLITEALPPKLGLDMAEELLARGLQIRWNSFAMVDPKFDSNKLALMAQSGCESLCVGVETIVDRVLHLVRKKATRTEVVGFFERCSKAGIKLVINLIPNLPTTTRDEAMEALDVISAHLDAITNISIFPFEATISSEIGRNPSQFGLRVVDTLSSRNDHGQAEFAGNHLGVIDDAMTENEREAVITKYRSLAAQVAIRRIGGKAIKEAVEKDGVLRFLTEHLELIFGNDAEPDAGPVCFNWLNSRVTHFRPLWNRIFHWLNDHRVFGYDNFEQEIGSITGLQGLEREAISAFVLKRLKEDLIVIGSN